MHQACTPQLLSWFTKWPCRVDREREDEIEVLEDTTRWDWLTQSDRLKTRDCYAGSGKPPGLNLHSRDEYRWMNLEAQVTWWHLAVNFVIKCRGLQTTSLLLNDGQSNKSPHIRQININIHWKDYLFRYKERQIYPIINSEKITYYIIRRKRLTSFIITKGITMHYNKEKHIP